MKVIDVLIKMANGEEVKPFKIGKNEYKVTDELPSFIIGGLDDEKYLVDKHGFPIHWSTYTDWLNKEVEIIDERKSKKEKKDQDKNDKEFIEALRKIADLLEDDDD